MQANSRILIIDFGTAQSSLLARRIRDLSVYCEVYAFDTDISAIKGYSPAGIILSGGREDVGIDINAFDGEIFSLGIPVLALESGAIAMAHAMGGAKVSVGVKNDDCMSCGIKPVPGSALFSGMEHAGNSHNSANYYIENMPVGCTAAALCGDKTIAFENHDKKLYGAFLRPESDMHSGLFNVLKNFLFNICGCAADWTAESFINSAVAQIKERVGDKRVLLGLSGGVDSSVCAALLHKAIGSRLICVFVDTGLMRKNEPEMVKKVFTEQFKVELHMLDCAEHFLSRLSGVTDPERKRKIIGEEFIRVFESAARGLGQVDYFAQGTIYPDIIESGVIKGTSVIKSHHNVGGLPERINFNGIIEPLRMLFKDEVRRAGEQLGLPREMVWRQPFPGPGLAVRILGDITAEKLHILKQCDNIICNEIENADIRLKVSQYFAVLTGLRTVGVTNDQRRYDNVIALRAVATDDFMQADWVRLPHELLNKISERLVNEVPGVGRVVFDITAKPPASIEWE